MTERVAPAIGETFGPYRIESVLGRGGMGTVYLATHERLARRVALKVIASELASDSDFRVRFLRESQLAASLDHPNVIPIYDADEVDGVLYLAMRYVAGPSLQTLLRSRGTLPLEKTLAIATQVGAALDAAHAGGLVHRDVKPANILLAEPDEHVYLCDFGLAKHASAHGVTHAGTFLGTVDYAAPEQIQGGAVDGRADIYSLGCVVHHCLQGEPPFRRTTELAVLNAHLHDPPPSLGGAIGHVLARALAKDPAARFATGKEFAAALTAASTDGATRAAAPEPVLTRRTLPALPRRPRKRAALAGLVLVAAAAVAVGIVLAARGSKGDAKLRTFVDRVENVLEQSADGRREIGAALTGGFSCSLSPHEAGGRIASVADNRESILVQLGSLPTPTPQADEIVTLLQRALQQSIEADRHYRDGFVAAAPSRCPPQSNSEFVLAGASDAKASVAKRRFVAAFDPLAKRFDRRAWTAGQI